MSVLNQVLGSTSHSHKLEFMVRSAEELSAVMEELKVCDSGMTLQLSVSRLYTFLIRSMFIAVYNNYITS